MIPNASQAVEQHELSLAASGYVKCTATLEDRVAVSYKTTQTLEWNRIGPVRGTLYWLECLHLDKGLLEQQNTKTLQGIKNTSWICSCGKSWARCKVAKPSCHVWQDCTWLMSAPSTSKGVGRPPRATRPRWPTNLSPTLIPSGTSLPHAGSKQGQLLLVSIPSCCSVSQAFPEFLLPISTDWRIQGPWSVTLPYYHMVQQSYPLVFTQISWRIISTQKMCSQMFMAVLF